MNSQRLYISLLVGLLGIQCLFSQTFVPFATLDGNGTTMSTLGWTLNNSSVGETPGDPDPDANELILVPGTSATAASIQYNAPLDVATTCDYWLADFDIGMSDATGLGDGIAFIVSSAPITIDNASGGYLGIAAPGSFTGFAVCMDGYDNGCGSAPSPALEIRYNTTDECAVGPSITTPSLYANVYQNVKVAYKNGLIEVYFNGAAVPNITGNYNLTNPVYFTFTAANGGGSGFFAIKNANIYIVQPEANAGIDGAACEGSTVQLGATAINDYTYQWTPASDLDNATSANPIYTTPAGLPNIDTLSYIVTATIGTCNLNDTALVVASPFPPAPTMVDDSDTLCQGNSTTFMVNFPLNAAIAWYDSLTGGSVLGGGSTFTTPPVSTTTTYYAESIYGGVCTSTTRTPVTVTISPAPAAPTVLAAPVCAGSDGIFQATAPAGMSFVWYSQIGGLSVFTGNPLTLNSPMQDTTLYVESVDANGCKSLTLTAVTLQVDAIPSPPVLIGDSTCVGESASLSANVVPGTFISWYSNNISQNPIATGVPFITPNLTQNIFFYAEASTAIGCKSTRVPVQVIVFQKPENVVVNADTICPGTQANLSVVSQGTGVTFNWYANNASTTSIFTGTNFTTPFTNITLTYYVASEFYGCTSLQKTPVTAFVDAIPSTPIASDVSVCPGSDAVLKVISPSIAEADFYWYDSGTNLKVHEGSTYAFTNVTAPASFYIKSISKYASCINEDADVVNLLLKDIPIADFIITPDTAEIAQVIDFQSTTTNTNSGGSNNITHYWNFGSGNYSTNTNPEFFFLKEGVYPITLYVTNESGNGCSDSITKTVYIKNLRDLYIPTAFSPNQDYINDVLPFFGSLNTRDLSISIYSRWGKAVYTTNSLDDTWNGIDMKTGEICPEGVYTVAASYSINGVQRNYKGTVTIVR